MKKSIIFIVLMCFLMQHLPALPSFGGGITVSSTLSALFDPFRLVTAASNFEVPLTAEYRSPLKSVENPFKNTTALVQGFASLARGVSQIGSTYGSFSRASFWNIVPCSDTSPPRVPWDSGGGGWLFMLLAYVVLLHRSNLPAHIMRIFAAAVYAPTTFSGRGFLFVRASHPSFGFIFSERPSETASHDEGLLRQHTLKIFTENGFVHL
jgi:hypothetical protein